MKEQIDKLRKYLDELEKTWEKQQADAYKKQPHKSFSVGQWVTDGTYIGVVAWVDNPALNIEEGNGYFGLDIRNGARGFRAPCKRDEFELLKGKELSYWADNHDVSLTLNGDELEYLINEVAVGNWSELRESVKKKINNAITLIWDEA